MNAPPPPTHEHPHARGHAHPRPLATSLSLLLPLAVVVAFLLLAGGVIAGVLRWWLYDEAGSRWLVQRLPLVQVQGFSGTLGGERWQFDRLHVAWDGGRQSLTLEGGAAEGVQWTWRPHDRAWLGLTLASLQARGATLRTGPPSTQPTVLPTGLAWPVQLQAGRVQLQSLRIDELQPLTDLSADDLVLDARAGAAHRVGRVQATGWGVRATAQGQIQTEGSLALALQASVVPSLGGDAPAWAAVAQLNGPLAGPTLQATLRGVPRPGAEPPALDLQAQLRPAETWPLGALSLSTRDLDLSTLSTAAPQTRITAQAELAPRRGMEPLRAELSVANALPGRWNERRLPLVRLTAELRGAMEQPDRLALPRFEAWLADATRPAGRVSGSASWQAHAAELQAQLDEVVPGHLDGRAAGMRFSGPVKLQLRGLPSPDGTAARSGSAPSVAWTVDLDGRFDAAPQPVRLQTTGRADDNRLEVTQLRASAGAATADLRLTMQRAGRNDWRLESSGNLVDFDPMPWWPGDAGGAWRQGPHRLSAGWQLDLRLPGNAPELPALALLQRLAGNGSLRVHDSVLAGVPLSADVRLGYTQAASPTTVLARAEVSLGGNQLLVDGRGDPTGPGAGDRWRAELRAESLANLAPLARLHPALAEWLPRQGSAQGQLQADGRWPALRTEGQLRTSQLAAGAWSLSSGALQWRLDSADERPLALRAVLAGLQMGQQKADHLTADVSGTLADHRVTLGGALPLQPPREPSRLLGLQIQTGTRAQLVARGGWRGDGDGGGRWRARIERLVLGAWDGSADEAPPAAVWAQARDLQAELGFDGQGRLVSLQADAGRLQLADAAVLRWDDVRADWRGARPNLALKAVVEPFALAPLLARLQPEMGWAGDIRLTARVDVKAAERFDADLVFERQDGDLHIVAGEGMLLLGLTDLRLAVSAHDGVWNFTPLFRGRSLGEIGGSLRVTTSPERRWPDAEATLSGDVMARVPDIGIWSTWVPPGWRLAGELAVKAGVSGRFGEPRYVGEATGTGITVRNLLQGVAVNDGQMRVKLEGDRATVERFVLKAGDGTLTATGQATLTGNPEARLQLVAERFRALGRVDRLVTTSGQAQLTVSSDVVRLDGKLTLDEALIDSRGSDAPSLDDDVNVRRPGDSEPGTDPARAAASRRNHVLALDLDLGSKTRARVLGVDTRLVGQLRITNPGGRFDVRGTVQSEEGTYAGYGQKLVIERGIIAFGGPWEDPRLDILALRPNIDVRAGLTITGTAQSPRIRLYSEPDMGETDKLAWLMLGRAPDTLGRNDTALLQRAAVALLAGEGEAPTDTLLKNLGIDEVGLRQSDGDARETVITLGKQLSRNWYLGYERGVNATAGTWQLIYRLAQRFTLRAQSGLENSLDVIWTWRFQETPADAGMRKSTATPP